MYTFVINTSGVLRRIELAICLILVFMVSAHALGDNILCNACWLAFDAGKATAQYVFNSALEAAFAAYQSLNSLLEGALEVEIDLCNGNLVCERAAQAAFDQNSTDLINFYRDTVRPSIEEALADAIALLVLAREACLAACGCS